MTVLKMWAICVLPRQLWHHVGPTSLPELDGDVALKQREKHHLWDPGELRYHLWLV